MALVISHPLNEVVPDTVIALRKHSVAASRGARPAHFDALPLMIDMSVVFPDPDGPMRAEMSPGLTNPEDSERICGAGVSGALPAGAHLSLRRRPALLVGSIAPVHGDGPLESLRGFEERPLGHEEGGD